MDPLARLSLGSKDFVDITKTLLIQADIHSEGRLVMVHEGGQAAFLAAHTACLFFCFLFLQALFLFCFHGCAVHRLNGCLCFFARDRRVLLVCFKSGNIGE